MTNLDINKIDIVSLFSGAGAFEKAFERKNIPHNVVAYCEVDKYAASAYSVIHNIPEEKNLGDISKVNIKDIPDCDLITYGFPCFLPGTLVYTSAGYKSIEDINVGDLVLTHTNKFKKVLKVMDKDANLYYLLKTDVAEDIKVTPNHPFYVREMSLKDRKMTFSKPQWVSTDKLKNNHYIGIAINNENQHIDLNKYDIPILHHNRLTKLINTTDFWWLIGKLSSDIIVDKDCIMKCASDNLMLELLIDDKLNDLDIKHIKTIENNVVKYLIKDTIIKSFLKIIADTSSTIYNDMVLMGEEFIRSFLTGFLVENHYVSAEGETIVKFTDRNLAYTFAQYIAKGYKTSYRLINIENSYYLSLFNEDKIVHTTFYEDGYLWTPVYSITNHLYNGLVHNLEVEGDNSYTVYNLIAHNCQDISNAGKKRGIVKDKTRSGLLYYALDIIEEKKPKYAICENVKNLVGKKFKEDFDSMLQTLDDMGYNNYWKVINSKDHQIPQSRERVFVVSIRKDLQPKYRLPLNKLYELGLGHVSLVNEGDLINLTESEVNLISKHSLSDHIKDNYAPHGVHKIYSKNDEFIELEKTFIFPSESPLNTKLKDLLEETVDESYYIDNSRIQHLIKELKDKDCLAVREGTLKGFNEAYVGDSININYPKSIVKRGRVGKEITQTILTNTDICVVEKVHDNEKNKKSYLEKKMLEYIDENKDFPEFFNAYNKRKFDDVSPTITTTIGSPTSINGLVKCEGVSRNNVITYNIPKTVRVRVYDVDMDKLKKLLIDHKNKQKLTCREISRRLNIPQTLVEHWFRGDDSFSIPHPEIWMKVKDVLKIETDAFDKEIVTFETKLGSYDSSNRIYDVEGNIPTLTTTCKDHIIVDLESFKIRRLTPLETWRLMGFDDIDYYTAREHLINKYYNGKDKTNSQMYKMAGNSIVVNVLEGIIEQLYK